MLKYWQKLNTSVLWLKSKVIASKYWSLMHINIWLYNLYIIVTLNIEKSTNYLWGDPQIQSEYIIAYYISLLSPVVMITNWLAIEWPVFTWFDSQVLAHLGFSAHTHCPSYDTSISNPYQVMDSICCQNMQADVVYGIF